MLCRTIKVSVFINNFSDFSRAATILNFLSLVFAIRPKFTKPEGSID